jgi:hypothetical protein
MIRAFTITISVCVSLCLTGCKSRGQSQPPQEQIKIGDISSPESEKIVGKPIKTINFDVQIYEIPAENADKISDVWGLLNTAPLRFHNYRAFMANSFIVRFGRVRMWNRIHDMLHSEGGQKIVTVSLLLPEGQVNDIAVKALNKEQSVSFIADNNRREEAVIGPGILGLRIKAEKKPELRDVCELVAYPVFTVPLNSSIPQLSIRAKSREFLFSSAAFGLKMSPGDFIMLGPEKYNTMETTLDSQLFSNPEGSLFPGETENIKRELKPAIRVFLLVCVGMSN